jgi:hypothetical protein
MAEVYASRAIGLLVVFVARNKAVSLSLLSASTEGQTERTDMTFFGCQSMTVFFR